jgi:thiamine biosynthesis lipoprotein
MVRRERRAMGSDLAVVVPAGRDDAVEVVWELFERWEQALSRFRPDSELSYLNAHAGRSVRVSRLLFEVTATALGAAEATGGLYDPTVLRALEAAGYDQSFELVPLSQDMPGAAPRALISGWRCVRLDRHRQAIELAPGVGLDFGGIAKGMAVDAALAALAAAAIDCALVTAGGDLRVRGLPPGLDAWPIAVPTPTCIYRLHLERGALATSGVGRRNWRRGEVVYHHLIDPRTGLPARAKAWSVSVAAGTCAWAEAAAKAAFLLGADDGSDWLEARRLAGLFVDDAGGVRRAGVWPERMEVIA